MVAQLQVATETVLLALEVIVLQRLAQLLVAAVLVAVVLTALLVVLAVQQAHQAVMLVQLVTQVVVVAVHLQLLNLAVQVVLLHITVAQALVAQADALLRAALVLVMARAVAAVRAVNVAAAVLVAVVMLVLVVKALLVYALSAIHQHLKTLFQQQVRQVFLITALQKPIHLLVLEALLGKLCMSKELRYASSANTMSHGHHGASLVAVSCLLKQEFLRLDVLKENGQNGEKLWRVLQK